MTWYFGRTSCFVAVLLAATLLVVSCDSDNGDGKGGVLAGKWSGYTITATNGIAVTRDLVLKLKHNSSDIVTGTSKTGKDDARPLVGTYFPASSVAEFSVSTPDGTVEQVWRLEDGGMTLTEVSGGVAQVYRE